MLWRFKALGKLFFKHIQPIRFSNMMELMVLMIRKHTAIIPTVVDSDNPVDEKIHDFIQEKLNAWSQAEYTHIGLVSEVNAEEAKV